MSLSDASDVVRLGIITGPTAAGKSALAMALAERIGGAIISADSRQVYRGFDIGTAKPTAAEQAHLLHFGLDIVDPTERYSAAAWAGDAAHWIMRASAAGHVPLVVGGTGFYVRALVSPLFVAPHVAPTERDRLQAVLASYSTDELRRWCEQLDPERARLGRTQLLRAIETVLLTGQRISALFTNRPPTSRSAPRYLVVDPGPVLASRIAARVDAMLAAGWLDEVRQLMRTVPEDAPAWSATGYAILREAVRGTITIEAAREAVIVATRQYAKRQRTWYRHQLEHGTVTRIDPLVPDAIERVWTWWTEES